MKVLGYLFSFIIIFAGALATIDLYKTFTATSSVHGQVLYTTHETVEVLKIQLDDISLENNSQEFIYTAAKDAVTFNGVTQQYKANLNGNEIKIKKLLAGLLEAETELTFYNIEGSEEANVNIFIKLEFLSSQTKLTLKISNENGAINYLAQYIQNEGFEILIYQQKLIL